MTGPQSPVSRRPLPSCLSALVVAVVLIHPSPGSTGGFCTPAATAVEGGSWTVLGDGSPGSVSPAALQAALDAGGRIRFDIGTSPVTLGLSSQLVVSRDAVLDGGGLVTLSGGNVTRVFLLTNPSNTNYTLTLQNITIANGATPAASGAGVYKQSGGPWQAVSLTAVNCTFRNNIAIAQDQDGGGGGIYATGLDEIRIHNCLFEGNRGSNGGALYSLGSRRLHITDSEFHDNRATGVNGNPGNGGNGGAVGVDGADRQVEICDSRFLDNLGNAFGAGFFSVMYDATSATSFRFTTFQGNRNPTADAHTGAAYIQGGPFSIRQSMFRGNEAEAVGAVFLGPGATGEIVNTTFYDNLARQGLAGALSVNTEAPVLISSCTIASNRAPGELAFAAGIALWETNAVTLKNTILADNVGGNVWNPWNILNPVAVDGGGNLQYPQQRPNGQTEVAATPTVLWADPRLAPPASNGGPTETLALLPGSPAIDQGTSVGAPSVDQRDEPRREPIDIGAFEEGILVFADGFEGGNTDRWTAIVQ